MANTPFKLKSGNTPSFKQMGSSPAKHIGKHPAPKDGHTHKGQKLFQRVHGALTGTKGKKFVDTKVGSFAQDLGTDIKTGQKLWSTRNKRIKDYTEKHSIKGKLKRERDKVESKMKNIKSEFPELIKPVKTNIKTKTKTSSSDIIQKGKEILSKFSSEKFDKWKYLTKGGITGGYIKSKKK